MKAGTLFRMVQVLVLSALAGGALYFALWYLYLGAVWLSRFSRDSSFGGVARLNPAPYELPAALACMLLAAAFLSAGSWARWTICKGCSISASSMTRSLRSRHNSGRATDGVGWWRFLDELGMTGSIVPSCWVGYGSGMMKGFVAFLNRGT